VKNYHYSNKLAMILNQQFYNRDTKTVAKDLLGKFLIRKIDSREIAGMITEVEAYCGPSDKASHASKGKTVRTEVMFGKPGTAYVYLIYGMYYCFNVVTEKKGYPAAVLIRSIVVSDESAKTDGPGKLCRYLEIDKNLNKTDLCVGRNLWIEDRGAEVKKSDITSSPRIGVGYAEDYKDKEWRFSLMGYKGL